MRQKMDDRRERLGAYPRVDARPDLSEDLEDQFAMTNDAGRSDRTNQKERGYIPSYDSIGDTRMNADHGEMPFYQVLQKRRKGAIRA